MDGETRIETNRIFAFESGMGRCIEDARLGAAEKLGALYQEHGLSVLDKVVATYSENLIRREFSPFIFCDRHESDEERVAREGLVGKIVGEINSVKVALSSYDGFARDSKPVLKDWLIPRLAEVYLWVIEGRNLKESSRRNAVAVLAPRLN